MPSKNSVDALGLSGGSAITIASCLLLSESKTASETRPATICTHVSLPSEYCTLSASGAATWFDRKPAKGVSGDKLKSRTAALCDGDGV